MRPAHRIAILVAVAGLLGSPRARADESEGERLFREGRALMLEGRFDEACPKIAESQKLDPHVGTLLNLAACHEKQGKVATAWAEFQKALTAARAEGQVGRERLAQERIQALEPRVPWLTLSIPASESDVSITLDGATVAPIAWGKDMPIDPGAHVLIASSPRRPGAPIETPFELREGERRTIVIAVGGVGAASAASAEPEKIIVQPGLADGVAPATPAEPAVRHWVLGVGVVLGYLSVSAIPTSGNNLPTTSIGQAAGGISLYAAYAPSSVVDVGLRLTAGPILERGGGEFVTFGPAATIHTGGRLSFGGSVFFGDASTRTNAYLPTQNADGTKTYTNQDVPLRINGGFGASVDLSVRLADLPRGSLEANVAPFFIGGAMGNAWCLPIGVAYRFQ